MMMHGLANVKWNHVLRESHGFTQYLSVGGGGTKLE